MNSKTSTTFADDDEPVIIVGAGLAGLVAAYEITRAGRKVVFVEQENAANLGGQAFWSLGGLFLVDTPEQRRVGIRDSPALAKLDWLGSAGFDRLDTEDVWAARWADAYLDFASSTNGGGMREYLTGLGLGFVGNVNWAERGAGHAGGHGNSVPRFHIVWGTGPEVVRIFAEPILRAEKEGLVEFRWRHRVDALLVEGDSVVGVSGTVLEPSNAERGVASSRVPATENPAFVLRGRAVIVSTGGIGADVELVRAMWPVERLGGHIPKHFVVGVPAHVDGRMIGITERAGAAVVNKDRMWHYTEGVTNWNPIWPSHGIRVVPGPSSLWLDANGDRLPPPLFPGCDTLATLKRILQTGHDYSWFILDKTIIQKEFTLSGSEQNPDLTGKSIWQVLQRVFYGTEPVKAFMRHGEDFVVEQDLSALVAGMNKLAAERGGPTIDLEKTRDIIEARDAQIYHGYSKDAQCILINNARSYIGERYTRVAKTHRLLDPAHGPLIAVRMNILTRKTLGGIQTDLNSRVIRSSDGQVFRGLYAAGEVAGFGGGGVHGYNALEGTFLTGCIFSGRAAGLALAKREGSD